MRRNIIIIWFVAVLLGGAAVSAFAEDVVPTTYEEAMLALINGARQRPLDLPRFLGMDVEKVIKDLPELEKILTEGLPPLTYNATLTTVARAHTKDMFAQSYYGHNSPDGTGYDVRIRKSGYPADLTGESLGMVMFANFITPRDAVNIMFLYMYLDELDPKRTEKRNILDPDLKEIGVSVDSGVLTLGGVQWNTYLATVNFGTPLSMAEAELLRLINAARANPLGVAEERGLKTRAEAYFVKYPELRADLEKGLAPLSTNGALMAAARTHVADVVKNNNFSQISTDGKTYEDRIKDSGYNFAEAKEAWQKMTAYFLEGKMDTTDPVQWAKYFFEQMLEKEFQTSNGGVLKILNPVMQDVGLDFGEGVMAYGDINYKYFTVTVDVAKPAETTSEEEPQSDGQSL